MRRPNSAKILWWTVALLIGVALIDQCRYLFAYPVPDTGMWFGDETWTMLTVRALVRTGVACVPEALGSSLSHSNGLVNGCIWVSGLIYGLPLYALANVSPVAVGRVITLLLSFGILYGVYRLSRVVGASQFAAIIATFALAISNAFYFSSHSARLDTVTGLGILLYVFMLVHIFGLRERGELDAKWYFIIPFAAVLTFTIYVHVPTLIALPALYAFWRLGGFTKWSRVTAGGLGLLLGAVFIVGLYWASNRSLDLLGKGYNQYYNVANSLPVLHLLSWRVQKINTIDRFVQVWQVAWPIVLALGIGVSVSLWRRTRFTPREKFFLALAILVAVSWGLAEGPAVFYNIHVLSIFAVSAALLLQAAWNRVWKEWESKQFLTMMPVVAMTFVIIASAIVLSQERLGAVGTRLTISNDTAVNALLQHIPVNSSPLVLTDEPGLNEISSGSTIQEAGHPSLRLMTNHLLLFGDEHLPLSEILKEKHVEYLLLYSTVKWHSPFLPIADSLYTLVDTRTGTFTDQARTYDDPRWNEFDTLRLYRAR